MAPRHSESYTRGIEILRAWLHEGPSVLDGLSESELRTFLARLQSTWIAGRIPPEVFGESGADAVLLTDRRLGRLLAQLPAAHLRQLPHYEGMASSQTSVRRWCWVPRWVLMSQDEDLLLMDDENVVPLLEEAGAGCTKRDYAIGIVEHHVRDQVHHALWDGATGLSERLRQAGQWVPLARTIGADSLAVYLERLGAYGVSHAVSEAELRQRVLDLRRCHANEQVPPELERQGVRWVARMDRANIMPGRLVVEADTGRMWAEETPFVSLRRKGAP